MAATPTANRVDARTLVDAAVRVAVCGPVVMWFLANAVGVSHRDDHEGLLMDVIEQLIVEHRVVEALVTLVDAAERASRNVALMELVDALSTHMEVEERILHPIIEARLGRQTATDADEQHDNVRHVLSKLFESFDDDERFAAAVAELTADFREHVTAEEEVLFPALRHGAASKVAELGEAARVEQKVKSALAVEGLGGTY